MTQQEYQALLDEAATRLRVIGTHRAADGTLHVFTTGQDAELEAARAAAEAPAPK